MPLDHLGIVAAACKELRLAERIDRLMDNDHPDKIVSTGQAVTALIINGLGFVNNRLYLVKYFFRDKPLDRLIAPGITANNLNDYVLGRALDEIADYGVTELFCEIMYPIASERGLIGRTAGHDTTSISVEGEYRLSETEVPKLLRVRHGNSKDRRPDLKQVVLELTASGPSGIPFWMEARDGNNSDKKSLPNTIKKMNEFHGQMRDAPPLIHVADSAAYHKNGVLSMTGIDWISRVPETVKEARLILEKPDEEIDWTDFDAKDESDAEKGAENVCKTAVFRSDHGGVEQRWLLVYSGQAHAREKRTFERRLEKREEELSKELWHLGNQFFGCETDAEKAAMQIAKRYPHHRVNIESIEAIKKYSTRGRPAKNERPKKAVYKIHANFCRNDESIRKEMNRKGRFIVATNVMNSGRLSDKDILFEYKSLQKVEGGFRFLKDPWFMVDSVFLKKEERIAALMMIMALCLVVYNFAQYKMRKILEEQNETLPDQKGREIINPTMRWIFQTMVGVALVQFQIGGEYKEVTTNISEFRRKIIVLYGKTACDIYGIDSG